MCSGIPEGTYELKIGASFLGSSRSRPPEFNTLRFDFKPASISNGSEAYIVQSQNQNENNFQVVVLGEAQKKTVFKGAKKEMKGDKECLLMFNRESKELRLERLSANINVKKTRDTDLDQRVNNEIEKLQKRKQSHLPLPPPKIIVESVAAEPPPEQRKERTFSTSSAGDEIDEDDEENVSALEQLMAPTTEEHQTLVEEEEKDEVVQPPPQQQKMEPKTEEHRIWRGENATAKREGETREETTLKQHHSPPKQQPMPVKKTSSFVRKSILAEDLQLSESSSEEEGEREGSEDTD